jgi:GTP-binding protein Era
MKHKSGYVVILGLPNTGKSTLLNAIIGQKLAITNPKPQTTRKKILGILTKKDYQIIFLDTPGIINPSYLLQEKMMEQVESSIKDADVLLILIDSYADSSGDKIFKTAFSKNLNRFKKNVIVVINKIDLIKQEDTVGIIKHFEELKMFKAVIPVSALENFNIDRLIKIIVDELPEGPAFYPDDIVADENERFFVSEIIREKILEQFSEEVPYSCEILITEFKERKEGKDYISAEIVVERDSQKAIIVGKGGSKIKKLGTVAREAVEEFLQRKVFLEVRVKVRKNWRSDGNMLKSFGYSSEK